IVIVVVIWRAEGCCIYRKIQQLLQQTLLHINSSSSSQRVDLLVLLKIRH
ncbi:hypothetical protein KSS87_013859, partial [Heliosperma pusillum]